jgi:hypothetical protein
MNFSPTQSNSLMFTLLTKLMSRKIHAYVNKGIIQVECLRKIGERENYDMNSVDCLLQW